jgi:hypothetical protein
VRGGKKAYEARLRSASILQAEIDALAATAGAVDQPGKTQTAGKTDQPPAAGTARGPDQRPGAGTARGPDQPTDAAATSSSAAE